MRLILEMTPTKQGQVRVEVRTVEPQVTVAWQDITVDFGRPGGLQPPGIMLHLNAEVWAALKREAGE